ncbi:MAG: acylneuraminate cytidylyltransferase family protein [Coriobacteriia bacterium]|nr:acylneuraminate cytidylyltransferase family protein [Coriobacteriia bacterium]
MHQGRTVLALILARGGSKGLPCKNVLPLRGRPLITWTIEAALAAGAIDRVVVTTDDERIASVSRETGADVPFLRPAELALDTSPSVDAVLHALDFLEGADGEVFDYIALLEPTSPLRAPGDIDRAIELLFANEDRADAVVSVGEVHMEHPAIVKRVEDGYLRPFVDEVATVTRRQDLGPALFPYGVIYLVKVAVLRETRSFYPDRTIPLPIERWQNYEIDDAYDLAVVEAVLNLRLKEDVR